VRGDENKETERRGGRGKGEEGGAARGKGKGRGNGKENTVITGKSVYQ
jgi:hypothetical protein